MKHQSALKETEIGMIPEDWEVKKVEELGKIITGKTPKTADKDNFGKDYPFITPRDMSGQKDIKNTERYLSKKGKDSVRNCLLPAKCIAVSCIGSDMGKVIMTTIESVTNQQINSIIPYKVSADFIYYSLLNIFDLIKNSGKQSTAVPIMNKSQFSKLKVAVPNDLIEAECVAKILSDLDSKIELNHQMNKTLEGIAQALFKHWFIDFEFPNEKGKPYKSSGSEMVDSEVGGIPQAWKVGNFEEIIEITSGKRPNDKSDVKTSEFNIPLIGASSIMGFVKESLYDEPIIVIGRVGTHGVVQRVLFPSFPSDNTLVIKSKYYAYAYHALKKIDYESLNVGTTQPLITQSGIKNLRIIIPEEKVLNQYENRVWNMFIKIHQNNMEIETLLSIRDSLLPRLMSGKIRVNTGGAS